MSEKKEKSLPGGIVKGDPVLCIDAFVESKQTSPPSRFTPGTLIEAMDKIHNFVKDPKIKKRLKESAGIGTEATRAGIIETLISRGFLKKQGKHLISTDLGRKVVDHLPLPLRDPGTTALWEDFLDAVEKGKAQKGEFLSQQVKMLPHLIKDIIEMDMSKMSQGVVHKCPECGNALKRNKSKKKKDTYYWVCFSSDNHREKKPVFRPDKDGKPVLDI